jgi:hypothetical protein
MARKQAPRVIYQLKITLQHVKPPIWRRVEVKDCTLGALHDIIQIVMGWQDYHLHEFEFRGNRVGDPAQWDYGFGDELEHINENRVKLSQLVSLGVKTLRYTYDMGDSWEHQIQIEKVRDPEKGVRYPRCVKGNRACPPEDCGGPWGYGDFLNAIQNPKHERHEELLEWIGGEFDPEAFDADKVNEELR